MDKPKSVRSISLPFVMLVNEDAIPNPPDILDLCGSKPFVKTHVTSFGTDGEILEDRDTHR